MEQYTIIYNRLIKNQKKLKGFLKSKKINAYRLYDKDIPEYPYIIDIYNNFAVVYEKGLRLTENQREEEQKYQKHLEDVCAAIEKALDIDSKSIFIKSRNIQKGQRQYDKLSAKSFSTIVTENNLELKVNLSDYLDTGLFLDHRPLRDIIKKEAEGKDVLNLFAYTGSISVSAAYSAKKVITVDMSKTYIEWAKENFILNDFSLSKHEFIQADVLQFCQKVPAKIFDIIILDPPSFSNSKRMDDVFDVQRDHAALIEKLMPALRADGTLYFSNNFRKFKLDKRITENFKVVNITEKSIPQDFRDKKIHSCFKITNS